MRYKNILVPIAFSTEDKAAIQKALDIRGDSGAELILVHIIDYAPPSYVKPELPEIFASEKLMTERANLHLSKIIEREGATDCQSIIKVGRAKTELPEIISQHNADLVVMTRHNHKGMAKLIGSTTDSVVRNTSCDVLILKQS